MSEENLSHHHGHHHGHHSSDRKHVDDSEIFKRKNLSAAKRRKLLKKWGFVALCIIAILVTAYVVWLYFLVGRI